MLRKIFDFFGLKKDPPNIPAVPTEPTQILSRHEHNISRSNIHDNALKVLYRLKNAGFQAYLVGGCVRDLLLGLSPKDFDVVTNARPQQIRQLFRNCRLIGRRFRLAHIFFGHEIVEVATFRSVQTDDDENQQSDEGMLIRDNVYGTIEEDALRRDFTVNALYYNIADFSILDYSNGFNDLKAKTIALIGDPVQRYREDPVRILRAVRFAARLNFTVAKKTAAPLRTLGDSLQAVADTRLFDEFTKLMLTGYSERSLNLLLEYDLFKQFLPQTDKLLKTEHPYIKPFIQYALVNTDKRILNNQPVTPAFLIAILLWYPLQENRKKYLDSGETIPNALRLATQDTLKSEHLLVPKRLLHYTQQIWSLQYHLGNRHGKRAQHLFEHPRFRAAYDFLLLRTEAGEPVGELAQWWTDYQQVDPDQREKMVSALSPNQKRSRKRKRKR